MIVWLIMALVFLSTYVWAFTEAGSLTVKKRAVPFALCIVGVLVAELCVKEMTDIVNFALTGIKWLAVAGNYVVPVILLITLTVQKKKNARLPDAVKEKREQVA